MKEHGLPICVSSPYMQAGLSEYTYSEYRVLVKMLCIEGDVYCPTRVMAVIRTEKKKEEISMEN